MSYKNKTRNRKKINKAMAPVVSPTPKKESMKHEVTKSLLHEVLGPIARMVGHSLSAGVAYGCFCAAEIVIAKVLQWVFSFGTTHQIELFEKGETLFFHVGFALWCVTFLIGAIRLVISEFKLLGK